MGYGDHMSETEVANIFENALVMYVRFIKIENIVCNTIHPDGASSHYIIIVIALNRKSGHWLCYC